MELFYWPRECLLQEDYVVKHNHTRNALPLHFQISLHSHIIANQPFFVLYTYTQIFIVIALFVQAYLRSSSLYRLQTGAVLFAACLPVAGNILSLAGISPFPNLDLTPFIFTVSGLIYAYALFGLRLLDVVPIARHKLVDEMTDGVIVLDASKRIVDINPAAERLIGISSSAIGQLSADILKKILHLDQAGDLITASLTELRISEDPPRDIDLQILPLFDDRQSLTGQLLILRDITERKQAEAELLRAQGELETAHRELQQSFVQQQQLALIDDLTGINNHRSLLQLARREFDVSMRYRPPLSMMFFDIDNFKEINDTFGHAMGNLALIKTIQTVCAKLRSTDLIGRYGGDEFVILLPQTTAQDALPLAERIHASIADMWLDTEKSPLIMTISIGIAQSIHEASQTDTVENLLLRADQALYAAKQAGKNCTVIFDATGAS
ncbi:MAG: diguanylate cyclase [Chloroflexi bacterium]|nr:diguanylate cyclase [Chloroflexota bacterium]